MPSPFNAAIDEIIALLTTTAANELGITEAEVSIQSLNFNADERVAIVYEPTNSPFLPFDADGALEPGYSIGTLEVGVYSRAIDSAINSDATQSRLEAIREINNLLFAFAGAIRQYREAQRNYAGLDRIYRQATYDGTIDGNQGWFSPTQGTTLRHRAGQLIFQIPYCID